MCRIFCVLCATPWPVQPVGQPGHDHPVIDLERGVHGLGRDVEGQSQEVADEKGQHDSDNREANVLTHDCESRTPTRRPGPFTTSVGGNAIDRRRRGILVNGVEIGADRQALSREGEGGRGVALAQRETRFSLIFAALPCRSRR